MALKRGPFRMVCDAKGCDEFVDLETEDFEEAKEIKKDVEDDNGWTSWGIHNGYKNTCPLHSIDDC